MKVERQALAQGLLRPRAGCFQRQVPGRARRVRTTIPDRERTGFARRAIHNQQFNGPFLRIASPSVRGRQARSIGRFPRRR